MRRLLDSVCFVSHGVLVLHVHQTSNGWGVFLFQHEHPGTIDIMGEKRAVTRDADLLWY